MGSEGARGPEAQASPPTASVTPTPAPTSTPAPVPVPIPEAKPPATATGCRSVAHIGDSTSTGAMSEQYIPDPALRLDQQYARVGVEQFVPELLGGRSIVEHRASNKNGFMVASDLRAAGFVGCWVIALGTNDAANSAKDSTVEPPQRIERMMSVIGEDPVLWVDVATRTQTGYWAEANMHRWNEALVATLARYPNARIYRWSDDVQDDWYVRDGIHFTSAGYRARARLIADALVAAFPADAPLFAASGQAPVR